MADPEDLFGDHDNEEIFDEATAGDDGVPEEIAEDLYHAYMTHETANQRYRENSKLRGSDPDALRQLAAENLKMAKAKSFCSGCKRRGHWHKDAVCPLNKGNPSASATTTPTASGGRDLGGQRDLPKSNYPCHVVHVT